MRQAAAGVDSLDNLMVESLAMLKSLPDMGEWAENLRGAWERCQAPDFSWEDLEHLAGLLEGLLAALPAPSVPPVTPPARGTVTRRFRIVIVDDEQVAREQAAAVVDDLSERMGGAFMLETVLCTNVRNALDVLLAGAEDSHVGALRQAEVCTIAVTDMGLPLDAEDEQAIAAGQTTPVRTNGLDLLRQVRSYATNIPSVVLTTPSNCLDDPLQVCAHGINDAHYILKGTDCHERMLEALWWIIVERSRVHSIDLQECPSYKVSIDGVRIPLQDMPFRTFYALCDLSRGGRAYFSPGEILDRLDALFRSEFNYRRRPVTAIERALVLARRRSGSWWRPEWDVQIANVMLCWAATKEKAGGDGKQALCILHGSYYRQLVDALALLEHYRQANPREGAWAAQASRRVDTIDRPLMAAAFDALFGGVSADLQEDYSLDNLEKHVGEIRKAIHSAFNAIHRYIEPRTEVLVDAPPGQAGGYRVAGDIRFNADLAAAGDGPCDDGRDEDAELLRTMASCTVLVVEDDRACLGRLSEILEAAGFEVRTATNLDDALQEAQGIEPPDILSLDLQIPARRPATDDRDPTPASSTDEANGLRVLEAMRRAHPNHPFQVVLPTTHYNRSDLGAWAARLGVPASNIVPKGGISGGASWEGQYLMTVLRLRDQVRFQSVVPPTPGVPFLMIRVLPGSDLAAGKLSLIVNGQTGTMRGNQGKFMARLVQTPSEVVPCEDLDRAVYGRPSQGDERKNLIKNVRARIAQWLPADEPDRSELRVLEAVDGGLVLHGFVEGLQDGREEN